jgi:hypothetical protein
MRTIAFRKILEGVARRIGVDPAGNSYTTELAGFIGDFANDRIGRIWTSEFWPELMRVEERPLRADWDVTATYADGDEVIGSDDKYYVSQAGANAANDPTTDDGTWWLAVDSGFDRSMALDLDGYSAMGEVELVSKVDPRSASRDVLPQRLGFWLGENGLQFESDVPARVWVRFRLRPARVTGVAWSATTTYAAGDVVYLGSTGECYVALGASTNVSPDGATDTWEKQDVPAFMEELLKTGTASDLLLSEGQMTKAREMDQLFQQLLVEAQDKQLVQQGQGFRVEWRGNW